MRTFASLEIRFEHVLVGKLPNCQIIRRKIRSCDSGIKYVHNEVNYHVQKPCGGAVVAQRLCNGLSCSGPRFDSRWERCKSRASRPSQGTVNGVPSVYELAINGTQPTQPTNQKL